MYTEHTKYYFKLPARGVRVEEAQIPINSPSSSLPRAELKGKKRRTQ